MTVDGLRSIVGIYDADGTIVGEVSYWLGARVGRAHCALCDVSHGTFRAKPRWRRLVDAARVPIRTFHRDDAPRDALDATGGRLAAVVAETSEGHVLLVGPDELESCGGDVDSFAAVVDRSLAELGYLPVFTSGGASPD